MELFTMEVAGTTIVSGLEWRALTNPASLRRETRGLAKELTAARYVETKHGKETHVGFLPSELALGLPKKLVSLPALLAGIPKIEPFCLLIIEDGGVALLAALQNGLPAPGFDLYGPTEEVIVAARQFMEIAQQPVTAYGSSASIKTKPLALEDVVKRSRALKAATLRKVPNPQAALLGLAVVLALGGWGLHYAYAYKKEQQRLAAERLNHVDVNAKYAESIQLLFRGMSPAKAAFTKLKDQLAGTVVTNNGWMLASARCVATGCTYTWKNDGGTNKSFIPPEKEAQVTYSDNGQTLTTQVNKAPVAAPGVPYMVLPTEDVIRRDVIGSFQEYHDMGITVTFDKTSVFGLPPGLPGTPIHLVKEGGFTIQGPWYALDALNNLPEATAFDALEATIDIDQQQLSFKATGKYYVQ